jgi:hypothetical protein
MSYSTTYYLGNLLHGLPGHDLWGGLYVADGDDFLGGFDAKRLELESHIRSGDYFSMLATKLDDIATRLNQGDDLPHEEINRLVNDLLYIDRHYHLARKS